MRNLAALFVVWIALFSPAAWAVQPDEILPNAKQEARARDLSREIRCMVCQNQSIDDSDAPLARDLRILVRERISGGDSDAQVRAFLVARYGEFVLLKPPFQIHTLLLWLLPPLLLIGGGAGLWWYSRNRYQSAHALPDAPQPLTVDEEAKLARLLDQNDPPSGEKSAP